MTFEQLPDLMKPPQKAIQTLEDGVLKIVEHLQTEYELNSTQAAVMLVEFCKQTLDIAVQVFSDGMQQL